MNQIYLANQTLSDRIKSAMDELAGIVAVTLGPGGRPILIENENRPVSFTKDGVSVARAYRANTALEDAIARAAIEICEKTVKDAGDGTTTAIILGQALVEEGRVFLEHHRSFSPQKLARQLRQLFLEVIKPEVLRHSRSVKDLPKDEGLKAIRHVALISSNGDRAIADAVTEAVEAVGQDGVCIAEEGAGLDCRVSYERGFSFNSGLADLGGSAGPAFVNRNDLGDCMVEGAYVCLYDGEINDISTILPILQQIGSEVDSHGRAVKSPVIVWAHRFSDQVLKMMAQNFRRGTLTIVPVITPRNGQANGRSQFLHDLQAYVGGVVHDAQGAPLTESNLGALGVCETMKLGRVEGVILGAPLQESIETRIADLKKQMDASSEFDQDLLRYRIGRLTGGVATIYAGGKTQLEARERHARVVDSICAVRSALQEGVVPGGGVLLAVIGEAVSSSPDSLGEAARIFKALKRPFDMILSNADAQTDLKELGFDSSGNFMVYDAVKHQTVEFWAGGILDPTRVTLAALENALSIAQLLMTLGGAIVIEKDAGRQQVKAIQEGLMQAIEKDALG